MVGMNELFLMFAVVSPLLVVTSMMVLFAGADAALFAMRQAG
jgi:hypothetical protein